MTKIRYLRYTIVITYSEPLDRYLVTLPEWNHDIVMPCTCGKDIEEAAQNGKEFIDIILEAIEA